MNTIRANLTGIGDRMCPLIRASPEELDFGIDKPLGIHFSACAEGNIGSLLGGLTCETTNVYVNLHCGGPCKLCKGKEHIMSPGEKGWSPIMSKLKIPKAMRKCTSLEIDPPGGMRWVMLFNFLQHDYDKLPKTLVFLKDTYQNAINKTFKRNKGSFTKKLYPKLVPGVPVPIPRLLQQIAKNKVQVGFQHLTQRVNWHTRGFIMGQDFQGAIFKDLYSFFLCTEAPDTGWPAIPGGLVAVERTRIRRLPRETYEQLRNVLLQMKDPVSATTAAVAIEHTIAAMFGCAGPETYPKCPPLTVNETNGQQTAISDDGLLMGSRPLNV